MSSAEEQPEPFFFTFHGIAGKQNLFHVPHCETDRFWRSSLGLTPEKYIKQA